MADSITTSPGSINKTGDAWALFKKNYGTEVDASFVENYKLEGRVMTRTIDSGKSASFPAVGTVGARYHVPGTDILGQIVDHNERLLTLDPMLISDVFIANIEEAMNHYDVRGEYTRQQGYELARLRMRNELRCAIRAARVTTSVVDGQPGGAVLKNITMHTSATVLAAGFRTARQTFDEKNLTDNPAEYTAALRPTQYYLLTENKDLLDGDYSPERRGSYTDAKIESIARLPIVMINAIPNTNESADTNVLSKYRANYADTVGIIWHRSAVGTLQLLGLSVEDVYQGNKQGTLMLSKYALGHGELRSDGAFELSKAAP